MSEVTLRRYVLPSVKGEGWAIFVIGSDGYFSAVSDWGNYAYIWTHPGCEFRKFLSRCDTHYVWTKITHGRKAYVFDEEGTEKNIRKRLWDMMGDAEIDITQHDAALESLAGELDDEHHGLARWAAGLDFDFCYYEGIIATKPEGDSWGFATRVFPRLQALLREELEREATIAEGVPCS